MYGSRRGRRTASGSKRRSVHQDDLVMSKLRVELFFGGEADDWRHRVPALHLNGETPTHQDAQRDYLSAIAFALEGDPRD
jgi:hypothetical protein